MKVKGRLEESIKAVSLSVTNNLKASVQNRFYDCITMYTMGQRPRQFERLVILGWRELDRLVACILQPLDVMPQLKYPLKIPCVL